MRWLLIAGLLCLPMAGCAGSGETTDEETTTDTAKKYECKGCGTTADGPGKCDCGAEMTEVEE